MLSLDKVFHAQTVLKNIIRETSVVRAYGIAPDCELYLKPENLQIQTSDQKIFCRYTITQQGNQIILRYFFRLQKLLFLHTDYPELQHFWELMAKKNNEMLVLKKL